MGVGVKIVFNHHRLVKISCFLVTKSRFTEQWLHGYSYCALDLERPRGLLNKRGFDYSGRISTCDAYSVSQLELMTLMVSTKLNNLEDHRITLLTCTTVGAETQ